MTISWRVSSNEKSDDSKYNGLYKISSFEMYPAFSQDFPAVSVSARIKIAFWKQYTVWFGINILLLSWTQPAVQILIINQEID